MGSSVSIKRKNKTLIAPQNPQSPFPSRFISSPQNPPENMSDVPNDAYREILRRVPVDSLFICRSVCKSWRSIIDEPGFAKTHFNHGIGDGWMIHRSSRGKLFLLPLSHLIYRNTTPLYVKSPISAIKLMPPAGPGISGLRRLPAPCCNGLVLMASGNKKLCWVIWNPFTGESIKLPLCDDFPELKQNSKPVCGIGLGYDEVGDDYKAVMIFREKTFICSVNSLAWRVIEGFLNVYWSRTNGVYANGALHWIAYSGELGRYAIIALDLTTESYRNIELPSSVTRENTPHDALGMNLVVSLDGCLFPSSVSTMDRFVVWRYSADGIIWNQVFDERHRDSYFGEVSVIAHLKNENLFLLRYTDRLFVWYDVKQICSRDVKMGVNLDESFDDKDPNFVNFTSQVIPSSLIRLKRGAAASENIEKSLKRKRKRADVEKLEMEVCYNHELRRTRRVPFAKVRIGGW